MRKPNEGGIAFGGDVVQSVCPGKPERDGSREKVSQHGGGQAGRQAGRKAANRWAGSCIRAGCSCSAMGDASTATQTHKPATEDVDRI